MHLANEAVGQALEIESILRWDHGEPRYAYTPEQLFFFSRTGRADSRHPAESHGRTAKTMMALLQKVRADMKPLESMALSKLGLLPSQSSDRGASLTLRSGKRPSGRD